MNDDRRNMKIMPGKWLINGDIDEHNKHGEIGHFCGFENDFWNLFVYDLRLHLLPLNIH